MATEPKKPAEPKTAADLRAAFLSRVNQETVPGAFLDGPRLVARCKRLAGRTHVVGNTTFVFDKLGVTSNVIDAGKARVDYEVLLRLNGVEKVGHSGSGIVLGAGKTTPPRPPTHGAVQGAATGTLSDAAEPPIALPGVEDAAADPKPGRRAPKTNPK